MENNKGFVLISILALMPAILAGLIALFLSETVLTSVMAAQHLCRAELQKTQEQAGLDLKKLLSLNPLAKSLRLKIKLTKAAIVTALSLSRFETAALLKKQLSLLQHRQRLLDLEQKLLITAANTKMFQGPSRLRTLLAQMPASRKSPLITLSVTDSRFLPKRLAVKPDMVGGPGPVYELESHFVERQTLHVSWKMNFRITKRQWSSRWFSHISSMTGGCSASLQKEGEKWAGILIRDKFSLKP